MSDFDDPGAVAAADQDLARINRLLDATIKAWLVSRPVLAAEYPDPMMQLAGLSFALFAASHPDRARALTEQLHVDVTFEEDLLDPNDLPCLLALAVDRLSSPAVPDRKFVDDLGRRWSGAEGSRERGRGASRGGSAVFDDGQDEPRPHDKRICRNCHTEIEWASERPEEGWEYGWYHLPVIVGRRTGSKRCPIYAEPASAP